MWCAWVVSGLSGVAHADPRFTEQEQRWIRTSMPVVTYATSQGLPLDVTVNLQAAPGLPPVAMGHVDGRCKLVFSMRGNPEAEATEQRIPADLFQPIVEAIAAHEMAHCWRRVQGAWSTLPTGAAETLAPITDDPDVKARWAAMRAVRREEGFADLVGLAWTRAQHPAAYRGVHAWIARERATPVEPGDHHDTRAWVRLASAGTFAHGDTPFEQAQRLWAAGLSADE